MKTGSLKWRTFPPGVWLVIACCVLFALSFPFRMEPLSRSKSNLSYQRDGSESASLRMHSPNKIAQDFPGSGGYTLSVYADVEVPDHLEIGIYAAKPYVPELSQLWDFFFPNANWEETHSGLSYSYLYYDVESTLWASDAGYIELYEDGHMSIVSHRGFTPVDGVESLRSLLAEAGFPVENMNIDFDAETGEYFIRSVIDDMEVSDMYCFDSARGEPMDGVGLHVETRDGVLMSIRGNLILPDERLWDNAVVLPIEELLISLADQLPADIAIDRVRLSYHMRSIYADPFAYTVYPIWELYSKDDRETGIILNAMNGDIEALLWR